MVQGGTDYENGPIPPDPKITWGVTPTELKEMQSKDKLCTRIMSQMAKQGTAQTYMLLRRSYYWKGMRPEVTR